MKSFKQFITEAKKENRAEDIANSYLTRSGYEGGGKVGFDKFVKGHFWTLSDIKSKANSAMMKKFSDGDENKMEFDDNWDFYDVMYAYMISRKINEVPRAFSGGGSNAPTRIMYDGTKSTNIPFVDDTAGNIFKAIDAWFYSKEDLEKAFDDGLKKMKAKGGSRLIVEFPKEKLEEIKTKTSEFAKKYPKTIVPKYFTRKNFDLVYVDFKDLALIDDYKAKIKGSYTKIDTK